MESELRIPLRLISMALSEKMVKPLWFLASAKLLGHRIEIKPFFKLLKLQSKTGERLIDKLVDNRMAGTDGKYLFPRAWRKLKFRKRGGLYITTAPKDLKKFKALCFTIALKNLYRKLGSQHSRKRRVQQNDFPARYIFKALDLSQRSFERLIASAQNYKYISVKRQYKILGKASECSTLRKNLHGVPAFVIGKHTVTPDISRIVVKI